MNINSNDQRNDLADELSLLDIIEFIQESWKTITGFAVLGIAGAILYIVLVPKQYEAKAQIKLAQISKLNDNTNPLGVNIEEPQLLIARMALPTSYPKETIALCGLAEEKYAQALLAKKVELTSPKGVGGGIVDLKIRDSSKEIAKDCSNAVFELIKASQARLIAPYIDEASKKLTIKEEHLSRATQLIAKADNSGIGISATYLSTRDEIRNLNDQILNLQSIITDNKSRSTQLVAPIYLNDQPVSPKKSAILLGGLLIGGLLGVALILARKQNHNKRNEL